MDKTISREELAKDLEVRVLDILSRPSMFAATIPALEALLFGMLSLRGDRLGISNVRQSYRVVGRDVLKLVGPEVAFTRFPLDGRPEDHPDALIFYRKWALFAMKAQDAYG